MSVESDIGRIADAAEAILRAETGVTVRTRWNRSVIIDDSIDGMANALFRRDGTIAVAPGLLQRKIRWRVYLHELIHSFAALIEAGAYERLTGWEEGPVEMLQRLIRVDVMRGAAIPYEETHIAKCEAFWPFQSYCEAIEQVRLEIEKARSRSLPPIPFYSDLLETPLGLRPRLLLIGYGAESAVREAIVRASGILTTRIMPGSALYLALTAEQLALLYEEDRKDRENGEDREDVNAS